MNATADAPGHVLLFGAAEPTGLRLALPLPLRVRARVRFADDGVFRVRLLPSGTATPEVAVPFDMLLPPTGHPEYASIRDLFGRWVGGALGARVLGGIVLLGRERRAVLDRAAAVGIEADLPADREWGFEAALEVASLKAILRAYGASLPDREVARLAFRIERLIAGGDGDLAERLVAVCAAPGSILPVQGEAPGRPVPIPEGVAFLVLANDGGGVRSGKVPREGGEEGGESRARSFLEALGRIEGTGARGALQGLGSALRESHASLAAVGRTDPAGDALVAALDRLGPARGVFGARASGRNGTGPVVALVDGAGECAVRDLLAGASPFRLGCRVGQPGPS
ncbi:MAG TPA: hypothetical protein VFI25_18440 [Planctomycetota bacterium]|nr:hypothetical protein [Planctomycetota bacterium]